MIQTIRSVPANSHRISPRSSIPVEMSNTSFLYKYHIPRKEGIKIRYQNMYLKHFHQHNENSINSYVQNSLTGSDKFFKGIVRLPIVHTVVFLPSQYLEEQCSSRLKFSLKQ